jgi:HK97 family phage portal protein
MSFFGKVLAAAADIGETSPRPPDYDDFWFGGQDSRLTRAGVRVTPQNALKVPPVYASVVGGALDIASLPLKVYELGAKGVKREVPDHPLYPVLHDQPNVTQSSFDFRLQMGLYFGLWSRAYAEIVPGSRGAIDELRPIRPDRAKPEKLSNGKLRLRVTNLDGTTRVLLQEEVFWLTWITLDGVNAISQVESASESIALAQAAEAFGAYFFRNGARPGIALKHKSKLSPTARRNIEEGWMEHYGQGNSFRPAVMQEGMEAQILQHSASESQLIESRKYQVVDIARFWRQKPHKIGHLEDATFSNIEQQNMEHVIDTLRPVAILWEQSIKRDLILDPRFFAEFSFDALLRGDTEQRYRAYSNAITSGWITRNEVRKKENLEPLDGLDRPFEPSNMMNAGRNASNQGQGNNPDGNQQNQGGQG